MINGEKITPESISLTEEPNNPYDAALGGDYYYNLKISGINKAGTVRVKIENNKIIDKANNGLIVTTLPINIEIDNEGPKIGKITTNADEYGRILEETVYLNIKDCSDESGIREYEWQYKTEGTGWITTAKIETILDGSTATHSPTEEKKYYYRVIVSDRLGNKTTSDEVTVEYTKTISITPTMRLSAEVKSEDLVEITGIIKSGKKIISIKANRNEMDQDRYRGTTSNQGREVTTTFTYNAMANGTYEFSAIDEDGNEITDKINVSSISKTGAEVAYQKYNATVFKKAHIIFNLSEEAKIKSPERYAPMTFDKDKYATTIEAELPETMVYEESVTFEFENKSGNITMITVEAPIFTKVIYLRAAREQIIKELNVNKREADTLISSMGKMQVLIKSEAKNYYGIKTSDKFKMLGTEEEKVAKDLGRAQMIYASNAEGKLGRQIQAVPLESSTMRNPRYENGNVTGIYSVSASAMYEDRVEADDTNEYNTFRIVIMP